MEMQTGGYYYNLLSSKCDNFEDLKSNIENDNFEEAYNLVKSSYTMVLTMYLIKEHKIVFRFEPLHHLDYVPKRYLYEADASDVIVYVHDGIEEIKDKAFGHCKINKIIISENVKRIGECALCINEGEIEYKGTRQDFINKFLGQSMCFKGLYHNLQIKCTDGMINVEKQ